MRVDISRFLSKGLFSGLILGLLAFGASAAPLCTSTTLDNLVGTSCQIGNYLFTFPGSGAFTYTDGSGSSNPYSSVQVTPTGDGNTIGGQTGFIFTPVNPGAWTATNGVNGSFVDLNFAFTAVINTPAPVLATFHEYFMNSSTLSIGANISNPDGSGNVIPAGEALAGSSSGSIGLNIYGNNDLQSESFSGGTALSGTASLYGTSYSVSKDILNAALTSGTVGSQSITETFTFISASVPEPGPFVLTAGGVGLLFLFRRRKALARLLGLAALALGIGGSSAHASTLCVSLNAGSPRISDLLSAGSCSIGDVLFTFTSGTPTTGSYIYSGNASITSAASSVAANVINNAAGQIGFNFVPTFFALGGQSETITLSFTAQAISNTILGFSSVYVGSDGGSGAFTTATADAKVGGSDLTTTPPLQDPINLGLANGGGSGSATFATPVSAGTTIALSETLSFGAPAGAGNNVHLSDAQLMVTEPVSSVPEPVTTALVGGSLLALGVFSRIRRGKNL